jgi:hypothetical protein
VRLTALLIAATRVREGQCGLVASVLERSARSARYGPHGFAMSERGRMGALGSPCPCLTRQVQVRAPLLGLGRSDG